MARGSYELFLVKPCPGRSLPQFWHIFTFSAVTLALSLKIQTFFYRCVPSSLAIRFKPKNSKIRYRKRELWAFFSEAWSWSISSLVLTQLHFLSHFLRPDFKNPNVVLPFIACSLIVRFKPKNSEIRYHTRELRAFSSEAWSCSVPHISSVFQPFLSPSVSKSKLSSAVA
jgi:hypothetical protein